MFIEFEGVRQGADFYVNGNHIGLHENGVMAVGFRLDILFEFWWRKRDCRTDVTMTGTIKREQQEAGISGMIKLQC